MTDISRRRLLPQAVGGTALLSTLKSTDFDHGQMRSPSNGSAPRMRDSFDFDWKFFRGDVPGASREDFSDEDGEPLTCRMTGASRVRSAKRSV